MIGSGVAKEILVKVLFVSKDGVLYIIVPTSQTFTPAMTPNPGPQGRALQSSSLVRAETGQS